MEDIGIVKEISEEDGDWFVDVIPFNLKISTLLLSFKRVKKILGNFSNFDFTDDESNHDFPEQYEFTLNLSDKFYEKFIKDIGYAYWETVDDMKKSFKGLSKIKCRADYFWGSHMYHVRNSLHDLRLTDKFIKEFSI